MKYRNLCTFDGWVTQISAADTFEDRRKQMVTVCRYTLAVPRPDQGYDYIPCIAFGSRAWYAVRNLSVGTCVTVIGHIHSESVGEHHFYATLAVQYQRIQYKNAGKNRMEFPVIGKENMT